MDYLMPDHIPRSATSPIQDDTSKNRPNKKDIDNHRPLSPLGFEQGVNRSNGPALDPSPAKKAVRRRERRKRSSPPVFRKLLWVRQSYPDNYTDASTFLDHLQRNPKLQPYEFWRLVADSAVIVQQVCSVAIFVCCFTGIFQERVNPVTIVGWGSAGTILGWFIWDIWVGQEEAIEAAVQKVHEESSPINSSDSDFPISFREREPIHRNYSDEMRTPTLQDFATPYSPISPRNSQRLTTIKSAALIYCAILGMSPILKSLTKSTTSDSIWALACWLMGINVFFFDYSGGVGAKFPASLSTNAALMASTVLASRLASTTHVFLLTLFSIQVFGLFPVFRRHLRHVSKTYHSLLTLALVLGAGGGVAVTVSSGTLVIACIGCFLGLGSAALTMGGASWWLIGLQRWKDDIVGPWDVARPRLRR